MNTVLNVRSGEEAMRDSIGMKAHRPRSRAKTCLAWQRYETATNGNHSSRLSKIAAGCPKLTPTQLRVATLVSELLPSYEIAHILFTTERAVEKVRSRIRKHLALSEQDSLSASLLSLLEK
jgi:DNA-binding CsgD family transcriptional regulator